ncbi:hypothetical protein DIE28_15870 [Paracoccus thiocyanatus]|uniref:Uncharacterized protein n=1 Tax=Paracoccus thiocyanatus TaxID=34006 RepID=A0A3D8P7J3_9RHOB|nr:hypothetical protein DIE28_15870 [Paracoccus thiocyanatus]
MRDRRQAILGRLPAIRKEGNGKAHRFACSCHRKALTTTFGPSDMSPLAGNLPYPGCRRAANANQPGF